MRNGVHKRAIDQASFWRGGSVYPLQLGCGARRNHSIAMALPPNLLLFAAAMFAGAIAGATLGLRFASLMISKALGLVRRPPG